MRFDLMEAFPAARPLEAYERLLRDVMRGDSTLLTNTQEVELIWDVCDPLLRDPPKPRTYPRRPWQRPGWEHKRSVPTSGGCRAGRSRSRHG